MAEPRSAAQSSAPTRGPAPRQPAPAATTATTQRPSAPRATVPRQSASNIRQTTAPAAPRQAGPTIQQVTPRPQQAAPRSRQVTPNPRQSNPAPRQAAPRGAATATPTIRQQTSSLVQGAQHTQLPSFLTRQVKCTLKESKAAGSNLSDQLFRYPFLAALSSTLEVAKACIEPQLSTLGSDKGPSKSCAG